MARFHKLLLFSVSAALISTSVQAAPPYSGTIFIGPDIVTSADPTSFVSASYVGQANRQMFDRRTNTTNTVNAYLVNVTFSDRPAVEFQVNPEFGSSAAALGLAQRFAPAIGQLPAVERDDLRQVMIHDGVEAWGGGGDAILIHVGMADVYANTGIIEETLIHEAAHTTLDDFHAAAPGWLAAQAADPEFISTYARDNPTREDVAESFLTWLAVRHYSDRISASDFNAITSAIPNRLAYFDAQNFALGPILPEPASIAAIVLSTPMMKRRRR